MKTITFPTFYPALANAAVVDVITRLVLPAPRAHHCRDFAPDKSRTIGTL